MIVAGLLAGLLLGAPDYTAIVPEPSAPVVVELYGEEVQPSMLNWIWADLAWCESRGKWHNHRDGALQIIPTTWRAFGGLEYARYAGDATAIEQVEIATRVLDRQGLHAWTCWRSIR